MATLDGLRMIEADTVDSYLIRFTEKLNNISPTVFNYLYGATSNIQTQINKIVNDGVFESISGFIFKDKSTPQGSAGLTLYDSSNRVYFQVNETIQALLTTRLFSINSALQVYSYNFTSYPSISMNQLNFEVFCDQGNGDNDYVKSYVKFIAVDIETNNIKNDTTISSNNYDRNTSANNGGYCNLFTNADINDLIIIGSISSTTQLEGQSLNINSTQITSPNNFNFIDINSLGFSVSDNHYNYLDIQPQGTSTITTPLLNLNSSLKVYSYNFSTYPNITMNQLNFEIYCDQNEGLTDYIQAYIKFIATDIETNNIKNDTIISSNNYDRNTTANNGGYCNLFTNADANDLIIIGSTVSTINLQSQNINIQGPLNINSTTIFNDVVTFNSTINLSSITTGTINCDDINNNNIISSNIYNRNLSQISNNHLGLFENADVNDIVYISNPLSNNIIQGVTTFTEPAIFDQLVTFNNLIKCDEAKLVAIYTELVYVINSQYTNPSFLNMTLNNYDGLIEVNAQYTSHNTSLIFKLMNNLNASINVMILKPDSINIYQPTIINSNLTISNTIVVTGIATLNNASNIISGITRALNTNTTQMATCAFVQNALNYSSTYPIGNVISSTYTVASPTVTGTFTSYGPNLIVIPDSSQTMVWMVTYSFTINATTSSYGTISEIQSWVQPFITPVYSNAFVNSGQIHIANVNNVNSYTPSSMSVSFGNQSYLVIVNSGSTGPTICHYMGAACINSGSSCTYNSYIKAVRIA